MNGQERLAFLTTNYHRLQNLRFAPVFLLFIAGHWFHPTGVSVFMAVTGLCLVLAGCVVWYRLLSAFYQRRYGTVEDMPLEERPSDNSRLILLLVLPLAYFVYRAGENIPNIPVLLVPLYMLSEGLSISNIEIRRSYHFAAGASVLVVILQATIPAMPGHQFFLSFEWVFIGATLLALSVLDHLLLMYCFRQELAGIVV
jgi:hypothetical protein